MFMRMLIALLLAVPAQASAQASAPGVAPGVASSALQYQLVLGAGDVPLNVVTAGDASKPAILLIHGIGQSHLSFENQLKSPLTDEFFVVSFDLRGHANSGKPWGESDYRDSANWAGDVARIIQALKLDRPVLLGWSYGTLVVADYVRHYGTAGIRGIELVGAYGGFTPPPPPAPPAVAEAMARTRSLQMSSNPADNATAARRGARGLTALDMGADWYERAANISMMLPMYARKQMFDRKLANADLIPSIGVPVLLNVGAKDLSTPESAAHEFAARLKSAKVSVYADAGHSPFAEDPVRFNRELAEFARAALAPAAKAPAAKNGKAAVPATVL